jgi:hypothetical protein
LKELDFSPVSSYYFTNKKKRNIFMSISGTPLPPPTLIQVPLESLILIKEGLEAGLEYTRECLQDHDLKFGRTIRRYKAGAEAMERDISIIKAALENLPPNIPPTI